MEREDVEAEVCLCIAELRSRRARRRREWGEVRSNAEVMRGKDVVRPSFEAQRRRANEVRSWKHEAAQRASQNASRRGGQPAAALYGSGGSFISAASRAQ